MHQHLTTNRIKILSPFQKRLHERDMYLPKQRRVTDPLQYNRCLQSHWALKVSFWSIPSQRHCQRAPHTLMHVQWGHSILGYQIPFFFFLPELNGNFSYIVLKPAKNILHEKLKRIHKFKKETYHLLLMTSVKTEISYFSPLITISPSTLPIHD